MSEYTSKAVGNAGLATGIIGTALGVLNGGAGLIGMMPGTNNYVSKEAYDVQLKLIDAEKNNAVLQADLSSEKKMVEVFNAATNRTNAVRDELLGKISEIEHKLDANIAAQGVINAQYGSQINLYGSQINQLFSLTKMVIPATNVCPKPMPEYNSWTAPT